MALPYFSFSGESHLSPSPKARLVDQVVQVVQVVLDNIPHPCNNSSSHMEAQQGEAQERRSQPTSSNHLSMQARNQAETSLNIHLSNMEATTLEDSNRLATNNLDINSNKGNTHPSNMAALCHPKTAATAPRPMLRNQAIRPQIHLRQVPMECIHKCLRRLQKTCLRTAHMVTVIPLCPVRQSCMARCRKAPHLLTPLPREGDRAKVLPMERAE